MIEKYGTPEQLAEYRQQEELRRTPESKVRQKITGCFLAWELYKALIGTKKDPELSDFSDNTRS